MVTFVATGVARLGVDALRFERERGIEERLR